jgi:hypothetical protein
MIKILVGTPANCEDTESQAVLEYTLRKYASEPLEITWMKLSRNPESFWYSDPQRGKGWVTKSWATPFSPFRWAIPEYCGFQGRAIYLDVDMIVMDDIAKLWNEEFYPGSMAIAKDEKTFCCSLFDCSKAKHFLPPVSRLRSEVGLYRNVRRSFNGRAVTRFKTGNWNCLDGENYKDVRTNPDVKIVHCTSIPTQPQIKYALPRLAAAGRRHWYGGETRPHWRTDIVELFDAMLDEAKANGYPPERYETPEMFGDYGR